MHKMLLTEKVTAKCGVLNRSMAEKESGTERVRG